MHCFNNKAQKVIERTACDAPPTYNRYDFHRIPGDMEILDLSFTSRLHQNDFHFHDINQRSMTG